MLKYKALIYRINYMFWSDPADQVTRSLMEYVILVFAYIRYANLIWLERFFSVAEKGDFVSILYVYASFSR